MKMEQYDLSLLFIYFLFFLNLGGFKQRLGFWNGMIMTESYIAKKNSIFLRTR